MRDQETRLQENVEGVVPTGRWEIVGFCFVTFVFAATHLQGIGEVYLAGHQGFNGALRSIIGRNYVRYGFWNLRFRPIKNVGMMDATTSPLVHWHHPPLVHMLVGVSFYVFGESETSARLVPVAFGFLSVLLLWRIVRRRWGPVGGLIAAAAFCLFPLEIEYGAMPNYEALVIALMLGALWSVLKIRETRTLSAKVFLFVFTAFAGFTDWPAFIFAAFVGIGLVLKKPRHVGLFVAYGVFCVFLLVGLWQWLDRFSDASGLSGLAKWRAGHTVPIVMHLWWKRLVLRLFDYVGSPFLLLAFIGGMAHVIQRQFPVVTGVFGAGGMLYLLVFKHGSWVHVFFLSYLLPAFAELVAAGVVKAARFVACMEVWFATRMRTFTSQYRLADALCRFSLRRPVLLAGLLILLGSIGMLLSHARLLAKVYRVSRELPASWRGHHPPVPYAGRLDVVILARTACDMSDFHDVIAVHARTISSPQFRYYLDRKTRVVYHSSQLRNERLYIVPERVLSKTEKEQFRARYRVVSLLRYWIVDLHSTAPSFENHLFSSFSPSVFWRVFVSKLYPPYQLRRSK